MSHMTIKAIVYVPDKAGAVARAETIFRGMADGDWAPFDWCGVARAPHTADSTVGKRLIEEGMEFTVGAFKANLASIREQINLPDEELMAGGQRPNRLFRHYCYLAGQYHGGTIYLYDDDGEGIQDPEHLDNALDKWRSLYEKSGKANPHANDKVWVVPVNVHY